MPSLIGTTVTNNYLKNVRANGLGPRTVIVTVSKTDITNDELNTVINYLTNAQGDGTGTDSNGPDAFVVAGLAGSTTGGAFTAGTTDVVYLALQGTGTVATGADLAGSGATVAVIATFDQNYQ